MPFKKLFLAWLGEASWILVISTAHQVLRRRETSSTPTRAAAGRDVGVPAADEVNHEGAVRRLAHSS